MVRIKSKRNRNANADKSPKVRRASARSIIGRIVDAISPSCIRSNNNDKLGTESSGSELHCAYKQVADLTDKLDDATYELAAEKKKCSDIVKQLSNHAKKNKMLSVNLEDTRQQYLEIQKKLSEIVAVNDGLLQSIKELGTESLGSELHYAYKQDADLRDKLDDATCELAAEKKKCSDIVKQLSNHAKENKTLSVNLDDTRQQYREIQKKLSEIVAVNDGLLQSIKDLKETQEFLEAERNITMESLKEADNELDNSKTEIHNLQSMLNDKNEQCRQLQEEREQKDLHVQMLQDKLKSTANRARDTMKSTILSYSISEEDLKETQEFLEAERNITMESLQEAENELDNSKTEIHNLQSMLNDKNEQCRQLQEEREQKDLHVQMLQDKLESTENRARDTMKSTNLANSISEEDSKETHEFLEAERNITMESFQEAENELHNSKTEIHNLQSMLNDNNEQCRQLLEELEQKYLYVQMLQDKLESTENRDGDTLVSQEAEITGVSLALSEMISNLVKCLIKSTNLAISLIELKPIQEAVSATNELSHGGDSIQETRSTVDDRIASIVSNVNSVNVMISKVIVINSVVQDNSMSRLKQLESDKKHLEKQLQNERSNNIELKKKITNLEMELSELKKKITNLEMEISVSRGHDNSLTSTKNKLTSICDRHDKTIQEPKKPRWVYCTRVRYHL